MNSKPKSRPRFVSTLTGAFLGAICALMTWGSVFILATLDDTSHGWKGILILLGFFLPIVCVPCGALASMSQTNRLNYFIANLGINCLMTIVATALIFALSSFPMWAYAILAIPVFFVSGIIVERFASGKINNVVRWLSDEPPIA